MGTHIHITQDHNSDGEGRRNAAEDRSGRGGRGGRRRYRGPGGHGPSGRGPGGRGRERAKRGAVANGVLLVLAERSPLHGYELIAELEDRSEGRWRPSPGSMYPTLGRLEEKGLIAGSVSESQETDGKRSYQLTEAGHNWVARRDPDAPAPWAEGETGPGGGLRPLAAEVMSAIKQIGRFGDDEQRAAATEVLKNTKAELYRILAR